jgi:hypothetical protein
MEPLFQASLSDRRKGPVLGLKNAQTPQKGLARNFSCGNPDSDTAATIYVGSGVKCGKLHQHFTSPPLWLPLTIIDSDLLVVIDSDRPPGSPLDSIASWPGLSVCVMAAGNPACGVYFFSPHGGCFLSAGSTPKTSPELRACISSRNPPPHVGPVTRGPPSAPPMELMPAPLAPSSYSDTGDATLIDVEWERRHLLTVR